MVAFFIGASLEFDAINWAEILPALNLNLIIFK